MDAMLTYDKKKKKKNIFFFSRTKKASRMNLDIKRWELKVYQVCSNDDPRITFDFTWPGQICIPILLFGENVEKSFYEN